MPLFPVPKAEKTHDDDNISEKQKNKEAFIILNNKYFLKKGIWVIDYGKDVRFDEVFPS